MIASAEPNTINDQELFKVCNFGDDITDKMNQLDNQDQMNSVQSIFCPGHSSNSTITGRSSETDDTQEHVYIEIQDQTQEPLSHSLFQQLNEGQNMLVDDFIPQIHQSRIDVEQSQNDQVMSFDGNQIELTPNSNQANYDETIESKQSQKKHAYNSKKRMGPKIQAKCQRIRTVIKNSHLNKNIPPQLLRKIKAKIQKRELNPQKIIKLKQNKAMNDLLMKKRLNSKQLTLFIKNSGFQKEQWQKILDQKEIQMHVENSNKIGTSKHYVGKYAIHRRFLIDMDKKLEKIIYRSIFRVILRMLDGQDFTGYLDEIAQKQLHQLDIYYQNSQTDSQIFKTLWKLVQKQKSSKKNSSQ